MIGRVGLIRFTYVPAALSGGLRNQAPRQSLSCWDGRHLSPHQVRKRIRQLLRELGATEASRFDLLPWMRAILLVSPQPSDELALSVMPCGVLVLEEACRENPATQVVDAFLHRVGQFQGAAANHQPASSSESAGQAPAGSEFSRPPAYFNQALYADWIGRLSQPWRLEDAWNN